MPRLAALGLSAVLAAGTGAAGVSLRDGLETFDNPARGYATGRWVVFMPEGLPKWHGAGGYHSSLWELSRFSGGREQNGRRPDPKYVGGKDRPISGEMLADVRRYLEETRENGGSLIIRLGYTWSDAAGCEPSDFDMLLGHVGALCGVMKDFDDVIVAVEAGITGPWAEMHSSDYNRAEYMNRILATYCDNLPEDISILVRSPGYICKMAGTNTVGTLAMLPFTDRRLRRLGMYNDGYLGTWWDYGTWAGDFTRERGCQMLRTFDEHPYGGELAYVNRQFIGRNFSLFEPDKWNLVKDFYDTHLNYLRNVGDLRHTLTKFLHDELSYGRDKYAFEGMPDLGEYEGCDMQKFVFDHMGYRFVVRDARLPASTAPGARTQIKLKVENTGFGKLLLKSRCQAVLVGEDGVAHVAAADVGGGGFSSIKGGGSADLDLSFLAPRDLAAGRTRLYLRLFAPLKDEAVDTAKPRRPVRLANEGMWDEAFSANFIGEVAVIAS